MEEVKTEVPPRPRRPINHHFTVRVGALIARGFSIWFKNFLPTSLLALVVSAPLVALVYFFVPREPSLDSDDGSLYSLLNALIAGFTGLVLSGALSYTVFQQLRGRKVGFGESLQIGLSRILPVLGVGILAGLCYVLGTLACVIPGIIAMCALYVSVPVCVVEKPGIVASLKRSFELTRNSRWPIFGAYFVQNLFGTLLAMATAFVLAALQVEESVLNVVVTLASGLYATPNAVMQAVAYHDLRTGKEGAEIDELVAVFE